LYLRGGGGDVDHVVLGPGGIYVLETKNWSGNVTCNGDEWRRAGKRNFKTSPSLQVKRNAAKIRRIIDSSASLKPFEIKVEGVVVFTNNHATLHLNNPSVPILRIAQLPGHITAQQTRSGFSPQQLQAIGKEILKQKN
jgi:hypothetical protein